MWKVDEATKERKKRRLQGEFGDDVPELVTYGKEADELAKWNAQWQSSRAEEGTTAEKEKPKPNVWAAYKEEEVAVILQRVYRMRLKKRMGLINTGQFR